MTSSLPIDHLIHGGFTLAAGMRRHKSAFPLRRTWRAGARRAGRAGRTQG